MPKSTIRRDPTRTTTLRRKWIRDLRLRSVKLRRAIRTLIVDEDVFGLQTSTALQTNAEKQKWIFQNDPQKLDSYKKWLQGQIDQGILTVDGTGKPWTNEYVHSAYKQGAVRAYIDTHKEELASSPDFYQGSKAQFLRDAFASPESMQKVQMLYTRAFDQLKGYTSQMSTDTGRILATGLSNGWHPTQMARELSKSIEGLTRRRAETIARTETIYAHAEGQLDSFEKLGVKELGLMAEWSTAGDDAVCSQCASMAGRIFTIEEARALIPLHPNCRCAWIPAPGQVKPQEESKVIKAQDVIKEDIRTKSIKETVTKSKPVAVKDYMETIKEQMKTFNTSAYDTEIARIRNSIDEEIKLSNELMTKQIEAERLGQIELRDSLKEKQQVSWRL